MDPRSEVLLRQAVIRDLLVVVSAVDGSRDVQALVEQVPFGADLGGASLLRLVVGVVGAVGNALGKAGINIAGMQVARSAAGGEALMALTVDSQISDDLITSVKKETGADLVRSVTLVG